MSNILDTLDPTVALKAGALVLAGIAFVALIVVLVVAYRRRRDTDQTKPVLPSRIRLKDSGDSTLKRIRSRGDQAFLEAESSPGLSVEDVTLGDDEPEPPSKEQPK